MDKPDSTTSPANSITSINSSPRHGSSQSYTENGSECDDWTYTPTFVQSASSSSTDSTDPSRFDVSEPGYNPTTPPYLSNQEYWPDNRTPRITIPTQDPNITNAGHDNFTIASVFGRVEWE